MSNGKKAPDRFLRDLQEAARGIHTNPSPKTHEPMITVGPRWSSIVVCSCGYVSEPNNDEGALRRKAAAHIQWAEKEGVAP